MAAKGGGGGGSHSNHNDTSSVSSMMTESLASSFGRTGIGPVRVSSLSLVDLAESECIKATGASGTRKKEGQYINKSLMTLGHVIWKLSEIASQNETQSSSSSQRQLDQQIQHIPYQDSKLTRLLQPSLSGNAQICIVCNISLLDKHLEETHNMLKLAIRAKRIRQTARVTEVTNDKTLLQNYREGIDTLKRQLREANESKQKLMLVRGQHPRLCPWRNGSDV